MFQSNDNFSSDNQGFQQTAELKFVPQPLTYQSYDLSIKAANAVRLQNIFVEQDEKGNIKAASYDSGAQVRKHNAYTMVKAANSSLWMGDRFGSWHPLD